LIVFAICILCLTVIFLLVALHAAKLI